ncbi:hypothetical protein TNCV_901031 [Trichonephila clavipes]|nr:hypothetical protein TNCV_901031 [Trichonephila clavipes]
MERLHWIIDECKKITWSDDSYFLVNHIHGHFLIHRFPKNALAFGGATAYQPIYTDGSKRTDYVVCGVVVENIKHNYRLITYKSLKTTTVNAILKCDILDITYRLNVARISILTPCIPDCAF